MYDKKVLMRVDFNVPIKNGEILDDNRILQSLKTIEYAVDKGAKVILFSHLGRVKTEEDKQKNTLKPIADRLSILLKKEVLFIPETRGSLLETSIQGMQKGDVLLVENTRFEDIDGKKESNNDQDLGAYWASLGDIYINDAFGTLHRCHASNVGIASHLPNGIGFLVEKELQVFEKVLQKPERPFTVILGGSKVSDKIELIKHLVTVADYLLIGGGMAYTFIKAQGFSIGKSLLDEEHLSFCREMLQQYKDKIILPVDTTNTKALSENPSYRICSIKETKSEEIGADIGPETATLFIEYINKSKTIIWNGPVGAFETKPFDKGTKALAEALTHNQGTTIIGGGDTASAIIGFGYQNKMSHVSTGGGAALCLLEGQELKGIGVIEEA